MLAYEVGGEVGPIIRIVGVNGLCQGGDNGDKTGAVYIKYQILESFHFLGAVDMRLRKRRIGRRC